MSAIRWNTDRLAAWAVTVLATAGSLAAQTPRAFPDLGAFRDSLAAAPGNEALRGLERGLLVEARRNRNDPGLHVRLGLIALRLGANSDAASEFKLASQLRPGWGEAWLGLGRSELALGEGADTSRAGRRALMSAAAWSRAEVAVSRAIIADGALMEAIVRLARERLDAGRGPSADVVRMGLRRAVVSRGRNPESFLALGHVERLLGDSTAALIAFEAAAALPAGRGRGLLEMARLQLALGEPRGPESYFEVAAIDDSASVAGLRADFAWIATAAELAALDAASGADRVSLLRRFWTRRGHDDLRDPMDRLAEHYRRLVTAGRMFANRDDQRVAVWIRHGPPDSRATFRDSAVAVNDSWRFRRPEGDLLVHFQAGDDSTNYRVVESIFDLALDRGAPAADDTGVGSGLIDGVLRSRAQLSPFYQAAAAGRRDQLAGFEARERELGRAGRNLALTTDRYPIRFERELVARIQVASFDVRSPGLDVLFVLPGPAPAGEALVRVRMVSWSSADGTATALDTVLTPVIDPDRMRGLARLSVPPGHYDTRVAVELDDRGTLVSARATEVVGGEGPRLADLAVAGSGANLRWRIGDLVIADDPAGVVSRGDSLLVGAVVGGLPAAARIRYRVRIRPLRSDGREEKWRDAPGGGWRGAEIGEAGWQLLSVAGRAGSLGAGRYELVMEVAIPEVGTLRKWGRVTLVDPPK